jgi:hypothetical protein
MLKHRTWCSGPGDELCRGRRRASDAELDRDLHPYPHGYGLPTGGREPHWQGHSQRRAVQRADPAGVTDYRVLDDPRGIEKYDDDGTALDASLLQIAWIVPR